MRVDWSLVCVVVVSYQEYSLTHGPTDIPHTRRTPAAPPRAPPRPGERGVTAWEGQPSILHSMCKNADKGTILFLFCIFKMQNAEGLQGSLLILSETSAQHSCFLLKESC